VADLMGRLGARSRFQAGALAVTYGWVGPGSDRQGAHEGTGAGSPSG